MTRMLLLEDDDRVARGIVRISAGLGHEAVHCRDIACARETLTKQPFDLIMADLGLADGESGLDFLNWARAEFPDVRRVLISGALHPAEYDVHPPHQVFLRKPFGKAELVEILSGSAPANVA